MARAYDVAEVRAAADKAMTGSTAAAGLEAARGIYVATIDDWLKGLEESGNEDSETLSRACREAAVVEAWLAWAELEKSKKQWSAAKKTYDLACTCTVASKYASTWISYAEWCAERKKIQNATKQYQRALEMVQGEEMVSNMPPLLESAILF